MFTCESYIDGLTTAPYTGDDTRA